MHCFDELSTWPKTQKMKSSKKDIFSKKNNIKAIISVKIETQYTSQNFIRFGQFFDIKTKLKFKANLKKKSFKNLFCVF